MASSIPMFTTFVLLLVSFVSMISGGVLSFVFFVISFVVLLGS